MSPPIKFVQSVAKVYQNVRAYSHAIFTPKYLLYTNTGISVSLSVVADLLQQHYQRVSTQCPRSWNQKRTAQMAGTGFVLGPVVHYWYIYLDKWFPGRCGKSLMKKVLVDQFVCSPVSVILFLVSAGLFDGYTLEELQEDFHDKGKSLLAAEFLVWPPAQVFNFYFLPIRFRVLFDNTVSLFLDTYYSYVRFGAQEETEDCEEELKTVSQDTKTLTSLEEIRTLASVEEPRKLTSLAEPRTLTSVEEFRKLTSVAEPRILTSVADPRILMSVSEQTTNERNSALESERSS